MSLSAIATSTIAKVERATKTDVNSDGVVGDAKSFATGATASGAYMVQGGGGAPASGSSLIKKMLVGGAVGAGLGLGATFLVPGLREVTLFGGVAGWAAKGVIAAIGGAVGAVGAGVLHMMSNRNSLAMDAQQQQAAAAQQQAVQTPAPAGKTIGVGASGNGTKNLQTNLKSIGLYPYKVSGSFDKNTEAAIRKYEVLKGVQPSGLGTPEIRSAVEQDAALAKQYV